MMTSQAKETCIPARGNYGSIQVIQQPYNPPQSSRSIHLAEGYHPILWISRRRRGYRANAFKPCAELGKPSPAARRLRVAATIFSHLCHDILAPPPRRLRTSRLISYYRYLRLGLYGDVIMCEFVLRTSALLADVNSIATSAYSSRLHSRIEVRMYAEVYGHPASESTTSEVVESANRRPYRPQLSGV
ncbi:uncharacterized protein SCHCODRAFT_02610430 [Schizophyllum commune H4-8]|uniref:uncharacterized protein n=1 Tax=Schizophyllum commune (strain H4-8 / FGSC 9210) TaxID=578458 RepID=UPI00215FBFB4|nr:uncharacterized protein SCHCODRAFT_02610430 [Schizophyllum commune H4-8]KAI5897849.1 hypothetical protein SCHCODRAFT_02610430 [Schizophyllum commune H4-8]